MSDFFTLAYLDFRQMLHRLQLMARQPGRALIYVLAIGYFVFAAMVRSRAHSYMPPSIVTVPEPYASAIFFAFVALLGVIMYGAASGFAGTFSSAADARFLCGSRLAEPAVILWLQFRRSASVVLRSIFAVAFYAVVSVRSGTFGATGLVGLSVIAGALFTTSTAVPMLKLRAVRGTRFAQVLAAAIIAAGLLPLSILLGSLSSSALGPWASALEAVGPGKAINKLFHGDAIGLIAFYAVACVMLCLSYYAGRDLYPDLYASSLKMTMFRQRRRGLGFLPERNYTNSGNGPKPRFLESARGAWTIAWKEWIAFLRAPGARRIYWLGLGGCALAGTIFGSVANRSHDRLGTALALSISIANMVIIFITIASSFGLAEDLRKPLWWMGPDPVWKRLVAWVLSTSWRLSTWLGAGMLTFALTLQLNAISVMAIPLAIAMALYLRSIGLALYALLPSGLDQRGPLAMLRTLLTYICATPPVAIAVVTTIFSRSLLRGATAGMIVALLEALLLIAFAARRIQGRGAAYGQAEAA